MAATISVRGPSRPFSRLPLGTDVRISIKCARTHHVDDTLLHACRQPAVVSSQPTGCRLPRYLTHRDRSCPTQLEGGVPKQSAGRPSNMPNITFVTTFGTISVIYICLQRVYGVSTAPENSQTQTPEPLSSPCPLTSSSSFSFLGLQKLFVRNLARSEIPSGSSCYNVTGGHLRCLLRCLRPRLNCSEIEP